MPHSRNNSLETILTYENQDLSQWSVIWSTTQIPGMDNAIGGGIGGQSRRVVGRRRLRIGSLVVGSLLTMHCRLPASALTGGIVLFMILLIGAFAVHANPLRHFELYLGQWSISGPGRAFRIIPMLDGIGIAICINAVVRAICCCAVAAIAAVYVVHSVGDSQLPFTYCRDFDLNKYPPIRDLRKSRRYSTKVNKELVTTTDGGTTVGLDPEAWRNVSRLVYREGDKSIRKIYPDVIDDEQSATVGFVPYGWRNVSFLVAPKEDKKSKRKMNPDDVEMCLEHYDGIYPALFSTPAYNFFYVEVVQLRSTLSFGKFNITLLFSNLCVWAVLWMMLIAERLRFGKLVWNNVQCWLVIIPWIWIGCLTFCGATNITSGHLMHSLPKLFRMGPKDIIAAVADALEVALYIHSAGVGTEIITGKGLNHYAAGHIDQDLHGENVWHSCILLVLASLHSVGATLCALVDFIQPNTDSEFSNMRESFMYEGNIVPIMKTLFLNYFCVTGTLWIIPMYSKCTSLGDHSHLLSTVVFSGLTFSYMAIAFSLLKSALHTIFEYRVKLVFVEQVVVAALCIPCILLSVLFATNGGLALLESMDSMMTGVAISYVCLLELTGLLFVYGSPDFVSDMNVATEENTCGSRITVQWQILPLIAFVTLVLKIYLMASSEYPQVPMWMAVTPLLGALCSVPLRACHNAYTFLRPQPRLGT